ncbi:HVO_A0114 family putative DNA-binding protein [Halorubrum vacuolatum]|uniref:Regulatory protein, arsR family n=1 Tax=Halorubrum vacuolatum TaxID=63740 RepID=A0A238WH67_HALVU|nr:transcriptional regulator [Halorubrum vacuolatum]SNR45673.1 regulatory protein, arsR family [Halorubrum vacuolatum]
MSDTDVESPVASKHDAEHDRATRRAEMARALARGGMEGVQIITWETADEVVTPKRREIIELLGRTDVPSVRALSRELERDKAQVSRDLALLAEHGIIRYETRGNAKQPRLTQKHLGVELIH